MMTFVREYIIHVTAAALICSVLLRFTRRCGAAGVIMKLLCGIFLAYSIVKPVQQVEFRGIEEFVSSFREDAEMAVQWGESTAATALAESISQGTEAYILEKAKGMNVELAVEVELSDDEIPVPVAVSLTGQVAPYVKTVLSDTISQDLNIPKEKQIWILQ